jgi:putative peptide zinc metalloprotease protein
MRLDPGAWAAIGRCDGTVSLDDIFKLLLRDDAQAAPAQSELISLGSQLISEGFLLCDDWPHLDNLLDSQSQHAQRHRRQYMNPMAPRLPLGNPDRLLSHLDPVGRFLFSGAGFIAWLLVVLLGTNTATQHAAGLQTYAQQWASSPMMWLYSAMCYPLIKIIHELAHGLAVRRWGGQIREVGIGFLLLFPAPYVDASDANQFARRTRRAWVSIAGIAAELLLAALSVFVWMHLDPGVTRDIMFSCAAIAMLSTVLFNANPLVRLDGYYVLTDLLNFPGLAQQSKQFWQTRLSRYLLQIPLPSTSAGPGDRVLLFCYQPLALLYRISIFVWVSWWIASYHPTIGLVFGCIAIGALIAAPAYRFFMIPLRSSQNIASTGNAWFRLTMVGLGICLLGLLPLPDRTLALGTVSVDEQGVVRAGHAGFLKELKVQNGTSVEVGQPLLAMNDPVLDSQVEALKNRLPGLKAAWLSSLRSDTTQSRQTMEKIRQANQEMAFVIESQNRLNPISRTTGIFHLSKPWSDLEGSFLHEGDIVGYLVQQDHGLVQAVLNQHQAARLKEASNEGTPITFSVRLHHSPLNTLPARQTQLVPAPISTLPHQALSFSHGGTVRTNSGQADQPTPSSPTYQLDVLLDSIPASTIGSRAWLRIDFGYQVAAVQFARWLRQFISSDTASRLG